MAERIDPEERRALLVDAAVEEVLAHGWSGSSLVRIAERAQMSRAGVLHHFPTKAELLAAVLEVRDDREVQEAGLDLVSRASDPREGSVARLLRGLRTLMWLNAGREETVRLFTLVVGESVVADHANAAWVRARYDRLRGGIAAVLSAAIEAEEISAQVEPLRLATRLIALMDGLQLQWLHAPDDLDLVAEFDAALVAIEQQLRLQGVGEDDPEAAF